MESVFIFFIIIAVPLIVLGFVSLSNKAIVKRKLNKTANKKISEFKDGDVAKIVGAVDYLHMPLIAPLSGRKCVYYHVLIEERTSNGRSSGWSTYIEERIAEDFIVCDGNEKAMIDTQEIKSYLILDRSYESGTFEDSTAKLEEYLKKHGKESTGFFGFNKTLRYKEGILEKGEQVAIVGAGEWIELDLQNTKTNILKITANNELPVFISDDPDTLKYIEPKVLEQKEQISSPPDLEKQDRHNEEKRYNKGDKHYIRG